MKITTKEVRKVTSILDDIIEEYKEEQDSKGYEAYERSLEDLSCEAQ